jgi:hypothetical protein
MRLTPEDFRRRVANVAITPSALRNQGNKGIVKAAREFLGRMDLTPFGESDDETSFQRELDEQTDLLAGRLGSWGAGRKALNIYLCEAFFHRVLFSEYSLNPIAAFLEVALDSIVAGRLRRDAGKTGELLPEFPGVRKLTAETSQRYQAFASRFAKENGFEFRIELEILYWRGAPI